MDLLNREENVKTKLHLGGKSVNLINIESMLYGFSCLFLYLLAFGAVK